MRGLPRKDSLILAQQFPFVCLFFSALSRQSVEFLLDISQIFRIILYRINPAEQP